MSKKITCVLDACSYIYLNSSTVLIGGDTKTPYEFLIENLNVKISQEVGKEITKHFATTSKKTLTRSNLKHKYKIKLTHYENILLNGKSIDDFTQDAGEIENFMVSLDLFFKKKELIIFLTDDAKALQEGWLLDHLLNTFPYFKTWNSFDFLLYAFTMKKLTNEQAKVFFTDISSLLTTPKRLELDKRKKDLIAKKGSVSNDYYSREIQKISEQERDLNDKAISKRLTFEKRLELITQLNKRK